MIDAALLALRLVLAGVFVVAAFAKLGDRDGTRRSLADFGVPARLIGAAAVGLPLPELALAAGLIVSSTVWVAALGATVLLGAFTLAVGLTLVRGRESDCHCFGRLSAQPVGPATLARNAALLALAGFVAVGHDDAGTSATAWVGDLSTAAVLAAGGGIVLVAGLGLNLAFLYQLLKQNGRLWAELERLRAATPKRGPAIGEPAPRFDLPDLSGGRVGLDDLLDDERGLVLIFTDPKCGACDGLLPEIARRQRQPDADPKPVLISHGSADKVRAKLSVHSVERVLLAGDDYELPRSLGVTGTPGAVVLDRLGRIAAEPALGTNRVGALLAAASKGPSLVLIGEAG